MAHGSRISGVALYPALTQSAAMHSRLALRCAAKSFCALLAGVILLGLFTSARADCMRDLKGRVICDRGQCASNSHGEVYCSRYKDGAAVKDRFGKVFCAKGACVTTIKGDIICSARPGGAAMQDLRGRVTCEGRCERASVGLCGNNSNAAQ